ncbi:MAG TPA: OmpP1/FadL family transporter [Candidatus Thiothrix moscowensis]|uniref:OmpP1/FadL family transporter n=1 Tax=unclassified Thiothrix TaxID=2636184 RepID=UPI0025E46130|nr:MULTISPECIES: OmpP1/FadL family transporter [unclassified Thiothrix]HRJ53409.1 OmpP1/FadL family transporter [Candidatus Thiothrix moscowensis]
MSMSIFRPTPFYLACLVGLSGTAQAGGLGVTVQSASGGGTAATGHALADDASAMYYNPALLSSLEGTQINTGVGLLSTDTKLTNRGSTLPTGLGGTVVQGNNTAKPGGLSVTPSFYYKRDLSEKMAFGVGVNTPFGVSTEYDPDSFVRYEALESSLKTVNINPAVSWKLNDKLAVGAGVNVQIAHAELGKALGLGANQTVDSKSLVKGESVGFGANVGVAYHPTDRTTLSASYRSSVKHELDGDVKFTLSPAAQANPLAAAAFVNQKATTDLKMPASVSLAAAHQVNDKLAVHGDATWTQWSSVPEIRIKFPDRTLPDSVTDLQWEDTVRLGGGITYKMNDTTKLRAGIAFDPTPTPSDKNRTPRAPSADNWWYSAGVAKKLRKNLELDASVSLVKPEDVTINYTTPGTSLSNYTTRADVNSDAISGAISLNYRF